MNQVSRYILSLATVIGFTGLVYFICLVFHLPFLLSVPLVLASWFLAVRWLNKKESSAKEESSGKLGIIILGIGIYLITSKAYVYAGKYGEWDAWAIWNMHARYLVDTDHWKGLFQISAYAHTDYPLMLPANIAFFSRLFADKAMLLVPFGFHFLVTLCIPVLIFSELHKRSTIVSTIALLLLATDEFYIREGVAQYADTLLAFFFLCAFIAINHQERKESLIITGFMLGCCMWTKNEGVVLAGIFTMFYLPLLLRTRLLRYFVIGVALPLIVWAVFKMLYAPANDIVSGQGGSTWEYILQADRYKLIWDFLYNNLMLKFKVVFYAVVIYLAICIIFRRTPDKQLLIILTCLAAYMAIYVVTPHDLEWHLFTSQHRLLHQLLPVTIYALGRKFTREEDSPKSGWITTNFSVLRRPR
ncbi:MAG: hypothetical protein EOP56_18505 [Sphingobacteriales bacterium]|nr:MAG: hypothetical protein EOP56_18505 [Sphingobacteriales bacterium]